jgi:hypothetical protein
MLDRANGATHVVSQTGLARLSAVTLLWITLETPLLKPKTRSHDARQTPQLPLHRGGLNLKIILDLKLR